MALDKLVDGAKLTEDLTAVADAIREKGGTSEDLQFPEGFVEAIDGMSVGAQLAALKVNNNCTNAFTFSSIINSATKGIYFQVQRCQPGRSITVKMPNMNGNIKYVILAMYQAGNTMYDFEIASSHVREEMRRNAWSILHVDVNENDPLNYEMTINPTDSGSVK